jgi:hypothetical protein
MIILQKDNTHLKIFDRCSGNRKRTGSIGAYCSDRHNANGIRIK